MRIYGNKYIVKMSHGSQTSDQIRSDDWVEVVAFTTAPPIFSINVGSS